MWIWLLFFHLVFFFLKNEGREQTMCANGRYYLFIWYSILYLKIVFFNCCGDAAAGHNGTSQLTRRQNANDKGKEMESVSWLMVHWKQLRCHKADSGGYTQRTTNMKWTENKSFYLCRIDDKSVQWHSTASTLLSIVVLAAAGWVWRWAKNCRLIK